MKKIVLIVLGVLLVIQLIRIDKTNKPIDTKLEYTTLTHTPENIKTILKESCYDCHSNEVKYPWYTNIAPVSWYVKDHINEGRKYLNFSEYGLYNKYQKEYITRGLYKVIEQGSMPLSSYTLLHENAELSENKRKELLQWFGYLLAQQDSLK